MWSLVKFVGIVLWVIIIPRQMVFGQSCKFSWDNGTDLGDIDFPIDLERILDTQPAKTQLVSIIVTNVVKMQPSTTNPYIEPTLTGEHFTLTLTELFAEYEENEISDKISIAITFYCVDGTTTEIEFNQPVEDTNNHDPTFMNTPYIYTLPMPFPKNIELNNFHAISARDIDLTNSNVTFNIDPANKNAEGFSVSWLSRDKKDRKLFHATLVTTAVINILEDMTFTLIATDAGNPPRTTKVDIKIVVDRASSILQFARPLYIADLTDLSPKEALDEPIKFAEGVIRLQGGIDDNVQYTIHDGLNDYEKNFNVTSKDSTVDLRLVDLPARFFLESFVVLTLTASKTGSEATTVLHISLPGLVNVPGSSTESSSVSPSESSSVSPTESSSVSPTESSSGSSTESSTESSSESPVTESPGNEGSDGSQAPKECDDIGYITSIIILAILLTAETVGFVVFAVLNSRKSRKLV